ncbi:hypothetical protein DERP_012959 [Dermatophagoides pteronyssinus]|uniref:Uncharacterized protein n=1 Tax=Dermatophagoides pteronyssinus TaxID=6956 RepID=A0ABQ8ISF2_DERPT|nr:hypothetical protein DERP_012959 [Dermatophagoides pteronyssinus]
MHKIQKQCKIENFSSSLSLTTTTTTTVEQSNSSLNIYLYHLSCFVYPIYKFYLLFNDEAN